MILCFILLPSIYVHDLKTADVVLCNLHNMYVCRYNSTVYNIVYDYVHIICIYICLYNANICILSVYQSLAILYVTKIIYTKRHIEYHIRGYFHGM